MSASITSFSAHAVHETKNATAKIYNGLFDTLIHNCGSNNPQPALGQVSISTLGLYSISANRVLRRLTLRLWRRALTTGISGAALCRNRTMMGLNSQFYLFEGLGINSHVTTCPWARSLTR